jgi:hypothetical protein
MRNKKYLFHRTLPLARDYKALIRGFTADRQPPSTGIQVGFTPVRQGRCNGSGSQLASGSRV